MYYYSCNEPTERSSNIYSFYYYYIAKNCIIQHSYDCPEGSIHEKMYSYIKYIKDTSKKLTLDQYIILTLLSFEDAYEYIKSIENELYIF